MSRFQIRERVLRAAQGPLRALERALQPLQSGVLASPAAEPEAGRASEPEPIAPGTPLEGATREESVPAPLPTPDTQVDEILRLFQARLDLMSARLDEYRDELVRSRSSELPSSRAPAVSGARRRVEFRQLSERLDRLERLGRWAGAPDDGASQSSPGPADMPELSFSALRPPRVPTGLGLTESAPPMAEESREPWPFGGGSTGPRLNGTIQDLRLATLLEMLHQERRIGILVMRAGEHTLEVELRHGDVTAVRLDGVEVDSVAALRQAFRWVSAEFVFLRSDRVRESDAPRSIQGVMLEVLQKNDEAARTG